MTTINYYKTVYSDNIESYLRLKHEKIGQFEIENDDFSNPVNIFKFLTSDEIAMQKNSVEYMYMICLDTKYKPISIHILSIGTINTNTLSVRDIIINAALQNSAHVILAHNHPSGDAVPSDTDIETTDTVKQGLKLCGMTLTDHIIIGDNCFASLRKLKLDGKEW